MDPGEIGLDLNLDVLGGEMDGGHGDCDDYDYDMADYNIFSDDIDNNYTDNTDNNAGNTDNGNGGGKGTHGAGDRKGVQGEGNGLGEGFINRWFSSVSTSMHYVGVDMKERWIGPVADGAGGLLRTHLPHLLSPSPPPSTSARITTITLSPSPSPSSPITIFTRHLHPHLTTTLTFTHDSRRFCTQLSTSSGGRIVFGIDDITKCEVYLTAPGHTVVVWTVVAGREVGVVTDREGVVGGILRAVGRGGEGEMVVGQTQGFRDAAREGGGVDSDTDGPGKVEEGRGDGALGGIEDGLITYTGGIENDNNTDLRSTEPSAPQTPTACSITISPAPPPPSPATFHLKLHQSPHDLNIPGHWSLHTWCHTFLPFITTAISFPDYIDPRRLHRSSSSTLPRDTIEQKGHVFWPPTHGGDDQETADRAERSSQCDSDFDLVEEERDDPTWELQTEAQRPWKTLGGLAKNTIRKGRRQGRRAEKIVTGVVGGAVQGAIQGALEGIERANSGR
ncbi:hypothetical protein EX30DRAFT_366003 [Ascodesmis nigricans]|uniref:Uncharacterized protein n=1 Tax=Ascodesmis nigricans TaxID=341454 RepID=A0A4S2MMK6_9PEZI|nr:hypothetical protein EX30DRAFT_366003 [Ascodesmis nigricans]